MEVEFQVSHDDSHTNLFTVELSRSSHLHHQPSLLSSMRFVPTFARHPQFNRLLRCACACVVVE